MSSFSHETIFRVFTRFQGSRQVILADMAVSNVVLIPWDAESQSHQEWLIKQRVACGWHQELVATKWKSQQLEGHKCIFWIVSYKSDCVKFRCC